MRRERPHSLTCDVTGGVRDSWRAKQQVDELRETLDKQTSEVCDRLVIGTETIAGDAEVRRCAPVAVLATCRRAVMYGSGGRIRGCVAWRNVTLAVFV